MLPVVDAGEIAKTFEVIKQLSTQYKLLKDQYDSMQQQVGQMQKQYSSITGNYGWGSWNNSMSDLQQKREWAPNDWQSSLKGLSGGNAARYQQLLSQYKKNHRTLTKVQYTKGADASLSRSYQNQVKTNQAAGTMATYEFNDINAHLQTLYNLGKQIENAHQNNDLKSAIDLNSRIQLEVAYLSMEELRMQTLINQQIAQMQSSTIVMEGEAAQFNQAGEQHD